LEYRFLYGEPEDELCLVSTAPVSSARMRLLRTLGVDVAWIENGRLVSSGVPISASVASLVS
jgi:hypothetical protein